MHPADSDQLNELSFYTLSHSGGTFIHQLAVDAFTAQNADEETRPMARIFSLVTLYLHIEKNYTGKQAQLAHMKMAKHKIDWPQIILPEERGEITINDVLALPPGSRRDEMISRWCSSVWKVYKSNRDTIISICNRYQLN